MGDARPRLSPADWHRAGSGLQNAFLEHGRGGTGSDGGVGHRRCDGLLRRKGPECAAVYGNARRQRSGRRAVGIHPRVVQSALLHKRNPLHTDDELRRDSNRRLLRQHLARSGFQLGQAEHEIQGWLVPANHGAALYHQFDRRRRADDYHVLLPALFQTGL